MEAKSRTPQKFNKTPRVCVLGITGAGKSKFLSTLAGCTKDDQELFAVSAEGESCTSQINQEKVDWFGNPSNDSVFLVDTCGYGDSGGKDEDNTTEMFLILRALTYVNHFLLVLNSQVPRMDEQIQKMFVRFRTVFGEKVFSHISVIYNRWGYTKTDVNRRKREKYSEELRIKEINDIFAKLCNIDTEKHPIPCFFVDCYEFIEGDCDLQKAEFERIRNQCVSSDQFIVAELNEYSLMTEELQKLDEEKQKKVLIEKEQEGILKIIAKKKPELASKIQDFRKNLVENKINAQSHFPRN